VWTNSEEKGGQYRGRGRWDYKGRKIRGALPKRLGTPRKNTTKQYMRKKGEGEKGVVFTLFLQIKKKSQGENEKPPRKGNFTASGYVRRTSKARPTSHKRHNCGGPNPPNVVP